MSVSRLSHPVQYDDVASHLVYFAYCILAYTRISVSKFGATDEAFLTRGIKFGGKKQ